MGDLHIVEITIANTAPSQPPPKSSILGEETTCHSSPIFGKKMEEVKRGLFASQRPKMSSNSYMRWFFF
jgi:hypothetical protein